LRQFIRKFSLVIGGEDDALDVSELRCTFTVKKTSAQTPNEAQIRVYNLSSETASKIQKEFTFITLQAGYEDNFAVIFNGTAKQIKIGRESSTDTYLEILASDGDLAYNFSVVNTTLAAGSTTSDHIKAAGDSMSEHGVTTGHIGDTGGTKLARGKVMFGNARDYLRQSSQNSDSDWSIQDGKLQVVPVTGLLPTQAVVLTAKTGLIGTPEQTNEGIQAKALLNPLIKIDAKVVIDNKSVEEATISENKTTETGQKKEPANKPAMIANDGEYKVIKVEYNGDTRGVEWYCDIVCLAIDSTTNKTTSKN